MHRLKGELLLMQDASNAGQAEPIAQLKWDGTQCIALSEGSDVDQASLAQFNTAYPHLLPGRTMPRFFPMDRRVRPPAKKGRRRMAKHCWTWSIHTESRRAPKLCFTPPTLETQWQTPRKLWWIAPSRPFPIRRITANESQ